MEVSDALPTDELLDIVDDVEPDNFADENEIAETDDSVESEESQDYSDSENILTIAKQDKNLESPEETEVAQPMTPVPEKLKKAEAVGPVIITYDITSVKDKHFEDDESDSVSVVSGKDKAAVEVDEIEEKEEPGTPVISFSSPVSSAATRKRNISDNDSGELDDKESPAPKETIKTIRFESAEANEDDEAVAGKSRSRFGSGFLIGFLSAIAIIALVMLIGVKFDMMPEKVSNMLTKNSPVEDGTENGEGMENEDSFSGVPLSDSISSDDASAAPSSVSQPGASNAGESGENAVPTMASDAPVYDVVSTTRYLTTMAKEHYGNFNLWPIIYEENQAFLGHPDRIKPGTQVVIPPLSKYKVNPDNPEDVKRIKQKGVSIYSKYK